MENFFQSKSLSQLSIFKDSSPSKKENSPEPKPVMQTTDLEAKFVMNEFTLTVSRQRDDKTVASFARLEILKLEAEMLQQTFNQEIMLRLGGVQVKQYHDSGEIYMIDTPVSSGKEEST